MTPAQKAAADIWSRIHHYYGVPADSLPPAWIQEVVQSALLAKEEEIAKLRDALQEMTAHVLVLSPSDPGDCPICDKARQALSRDGVKQ